MRLFVALDLDESIRAGIARYVEGVRNFASDVRWIAPESLHVTLKFIGETPDLDPIRIALQELRAPQVELSFRGVGFYPTPSSARVFWIGIHCDERLAALAATVEDALHAGGIAKEQRPYSPHLTLARSGSGAPRRQPADRKNNFSHLQQKLAALPPPDFGTMTAREFFLYQSKTAPSGAVYTKLASFPLGQ